MITLTGTTRMLRWMPVKAYVLVGGRSERMGKSKAGLFLDRLRQAAEPVFEELVAVQHPGGDPLSVRTIFDGDHDGRGALFGLARALEDAEESCVVLAADYPLLTAPLLRYLRDRTAASGCAAIVPWWDGHPQPLCAGYSPAILSHLHRRIRDGRYDLRGLIREAEAEMIAETELRERFAGEPLLNVNTPEDLLRAEALYGD